MNRMNVFLKRRPLARVALLAIGGWLGLSVLAVADPGPVAQAGNAKPTPAKADGDAAGAQPAGLGLSMLEQNPYLPGIVVGHLHPGGPAAVAGMQPGDQILSADGKELTTPQQLQQIIQGKKAGDKLSLVIVRNGKQETVTATLASLAKLYGGDHLPWLGVGFDEKDDVVEVSQIFPGGPAARAGLFLGDQIKSIGGKPVAAPQDAVRLIEQAKPGDVVEFGIHRNGKDKKIAATIGDRSQFLRTHPGTPAAAGLPVPEHAMALEQQRHLAHQHQRIEELLIELKAEVQALRAEVQQLKAGGAAKASRAADPGK